MLWLWIVYLAVVAWIAAHYTQKILPKYLICLLCAIIGSVPLFFAHYSAIEMVYAFFGAPSLLCVLIALGALWRVLALDFGIRALAPLKPISFVLYAAFGAVLLLGALNIAHSLDIYHFEPLYQNLIILGVMGVMIALDSVMGIFFAVSCIILLGGGDDKSIIEVVFCPYLWLYSVGYTLFMIFTLPKRL